MTIIGLISLAALIAGTLMVAYAIWTGMMPPWYAPATFVIGAVMGWKLRESVG